MINHGYQLSNSFPIAKYGGFEHNQKPTLFLMSWGDDVKLKYKLHHVVIGVSFHKAAGAGPLYTQTLDTLCFAPPSLLQQSFNDKRKKNLFSRKFPFYKNKDQSEQETSDIDRKYVESSGEKNIHTPKGLLASSRVLPWRQFQELQQVNGTQTM